MASNAILSDLASKLSGRLILNSTSSSSPSSIPCWNGLINHLPDTLNSKVLPHSSPQAYAVCHSTHDVVLSMQAAVRLGVKCYARGSGHHYSGMCFPSGGLVVDLSEMKAIQIDAEKRIAIVQPGVTTEELRRATISHGLHFPSGHISSVGISGFILGGGNGWGIRHCGSAADNLIEAEVVIPSPPLPSHKLGQMGSEELWSPVVKRVNAESDPELLWGLKGAGTFLGVVTTFTLALHPVPSLLPCLTAIYPLSALDQVGKLFIEVQRDSPEEVEISLALVRLAGDPNGKGDTDAAIIGCVSFADQGSHQGIEATFERIRSFQPIMSGSEDGRIALVDTVQPYLDALSTLDGAWSFPRLRMYSHAAIVKEERLDGGLVKLLQGLGERFTSSQSIVLVAPAGTHRRAPRSASYGFSSSWVVSAYAMWEGKEEGAGEEDERHVAWAKGHAENVKPWAHGLYLNEVMIGTEGVLPSMCYEEWAVPRIKELKRACDPLGILRNFD